MKSLSIKTRLAVLVGSLLLLLVAAASFTVLRMKASNESLAMLYEDRVTALELLKHVDDGYNEIVDIAHKVGSASMTPADGAVQLKRAQAKAAKSWKAYIATDLDASEQALVKQAAPLMAKADAVAVQVTTALEHDDVDGVFKIATNGAVTKWIADPSLAAAASTCQFMAPFVVGANGIVQSNGAF